MFPSKFSKYTALTLIFAIIFLLAGCREKKPPEPYKPPQKITITYYKMNDPIEVMKPFFDEFKSIKGNELVEFKYVSFDNLEKYEDRIINELAEGGGPDIFSMPNYWIAKHQKKIYPMPQNMMTVEQFRNTFVNVAETDLIRPEDPSKPDSPLRIYGLPMYVDTLALYYNKAHFEDKLPQQGKPSSTWAGLTQDIISLTKADNSFERFERAGAALGRADNINHAVEILYSIMLQYGTKFYDENYKRSIIASQQGLTANNKPFMPGVESLNLYTSFALPSNQYYTWNQYLADSASDDKEIAAFAKGKVSMIFGFSDYYQKILDEIKILKTKNQTVIDPAYVRISLLPQIYDPEKSKDKRNTFPLYYAETVSRTSPPQNRQKAWEFLQFLTSKNSLQTYNTKTHKPTSRRDLIDEQKTNQIYGVFAEQAGFADSILIYDYDYYKNALSNAIQTVIDAVDRSDIALKKAEDKITSILPETGMVPPGPYVSSKPVSQTQNR